MRMLKDGLLLLALVGVVAGQERAAEPSVQVAGRVIDGEGRPIEGAAVRVLPASEWQRHAADFTTDDVLAHPDAVTDEDGAFTLPAPEQPMLHIAARGHAAVVVRGGGAGGLTTSGDVTVVLSEGTVHAGTVRHADGEPVAGARVHASALVAGAWNLAGISHAVSTATRTDERGRFRLLCAPRAAMTVEVDAPGHYRTSLFPVGEGTPLNFVVQPSGFVTGRAVGRDGRPCAGLLLGARYEMGMRRDYAACVTGEDGSFRVTVAEFGRLRLSGDGPGSSGQFTSPILDGAASEVVVRPVAVLDGQGDVERFEVLVRDASSGEPVVGARAHVSGGGSQGRYLSYACPSAVGPWGDHELPESDAEGRVWLELPSSAWLRQQAQVWIRAEGLSPSIEDVDLTKAEFPLVYELREEAVIHGRVTDADGPVAGAEVFWVRCASVPASVNFAGAPIHAVRTDADGRYELRGVPRAKIEVMASTDDHLVPTPGVVMTDGEGSRFELDFRLESARRFGVQLPDGFRAAGLSLAWSTRGGTARGEESIQTHYRRHTPSQAAFDAEGRVAFQVCADGDLQLSVQRLADARSTYALVFPLPDLPATEGTEIVIPTDALATGRVRGKLSTDGLAFTRFAVELTELRTGPGARSSGAGIRVPVDAAGGFDAELRPGPHLLSVVDLRTGLTVFEQDEVLDVEGDETLDLNLEPRWRCVRIRTIPADGPDSPPALGTLMVISHSAAEQATRRPPWHRPVPWSPGEPTELLLAPGQYEVYLQRGAASLTASGAWRGEKIDSTKFEVETASAGELPMVVLLKLPPPTPTEAIDR